VPTIDKLSVRVLVDSASDVFFKPQETNGVKTEPGRPAHRALPDAMLEWERWRAIHEMLSRG
jgi:hypothetical protein